VVKIDKSNPRELRLNESIALKVLQCTGMENSPLMKVKSQGSIA
jgi:hypothetical protein